ncbi:endo-1,4-beta-xylanase C-like isoform X2 [Actinia tenebrosa]|uniref:Endo-1,4-beta-xylanase C-like isoform X2 n=1 Tax=Actinia tenebrosa TaxID=6105 RepID=A0A6P8HGG1_ACTTE|nr:endo-1,4-beta-xylanase C-like isoform X2 [Actinia tenebrosa]
MPYNNLLLCLGIAFMMFAINRAIPIKKDAAVSKRTENKWGNGAVSNEWGNGAGSNGWGNGAGGNKWGNGAVSNSWGNSGDSPVKSS